MSGNTDTAMLRSLPPMRTVAEARAAVRRLFPTDYQRNLLGVHEFLADAVVLYTLIADVDGEHREEALLCAKRMAEFVTAVDAKIAMRQQEILDMIDVMSCAPTGLGDGA